MKKLTLLAAVVSSVLLSGCIVSVTAHEHKHVDLEETRKQLVLENASELKHFEVSAGRGSLKVIGDANISKITVDAVIGS